MSALEISGLCVLPLALRIEEWLAEGKLVDEDLERSLGFDGRALVEHGLTTGDRVPVDLAESLVGLVAEQVGDGTGLVELAGGIAAGWLEDGSMTRWVECSRGLVDGPGYFVAHAAERLLGPGCWEYEGGRSRFTLRLLGTESMSPELKTLLGALLARLAELGLDRDLDVRSKGIDAGALALSAELGAVVALDPMRERRLYRAALAGVGDPDSESGPASPRQAT
jgi:hypothetical protein